MTLDATDKVFDDRYEVIRKLGTGGMADVYLARDRNLGREVALKVLLSKYASDPQFVERFRREASNAASLNHPNIVQIYDRGEAEGTYYIAMEYLEGRTLKDLITRFAPLAPQHVISISSQILEALRYAHRRDIVHRDIKPQNIIVDDEGRVKVTDFGIARAGSAAGMTETGSILGTAHYLSPEQARGGVAEAASDLYSAGVVMYEMSTGSLPFEGDNPVAIAMKHVGEPPVPPRTRVPTIPEGLDSVILRALAKRPEQRYLTAQAFLDDLEKAARGERVIPPPPFLPVDTASADGSDQATMVMTAAGAAVATTAAATEVRRPPGSAPAHAAAGPPAGEAKKSRRWWPWLLVVFFVAVLVVGLLAMNALGGGGDRVTVPDLVGLTQDAAEAAVAEVGLSLEVAGAEESSAEDAGKVARQDPEAGDKLDPDGTVQVWLAGGPELVEVPDLVGKTQVDAVAVLNQTGLVLGTPQSEASDEPVGTIVRQAPEAGEQAARASTVEIWVSAGPEVVKVQVPDLVGMNEDEAMAELKSLKLTASRQQRDSDRPEGEVVEQRPAAGEEVAEGSVVTIWVSNASVPTRVRVPDVVGDSREEATGTLTAAGFVVQRQNRTDQSVSPGTVVDQDPAGGSTRDEGSTVVIYVAVAPSTTTTTAPPTTTTSPSSTTTTTTPSSPPSS